MAVRLTERVGDWRADSQVDRSERLVRNVALAGLESRNGYRYSEASLRDAAKLYEGKPVFLDHVVPWGLIGGMLGGGRTGGSTPLPSVGSGGTSRMNHGGLVTGPGGMDRVPALLTAGEFVVQKSAVEREGRGFWERLNRGGSAETASTSNVTQYGEINIHLTQMAPLGDVLRDLQLEGHRLAKRRG